MVPPGKQVAPVIDYSHDSYAIKWPPMISPLPVAEKENGRNGNYYRTARFLNLL